jgi:hypothetical protein
MAGDETSLEMISSPTANVKLLVDNTLREPISSFSLLLRKFKIRMSSLLTRFICTRSIRLVNVANIILAPKVFMSLEEMFVYYAYSVLCAVCLTASVV